MKIDVINRDMELLFARCIIANELDSNISLAYKFSDPDGVRTGKSGWSFGVCQFDISNNPNALMALRDCGFTTDEVRALRNQDPDVDMITMNAKLLTAQDTLNQWDARQLRECLTWPLKLCRELAVDFANQYAYLHIADYHNQFGMSKGGKMYTWLKGRSGALTAENVRDFKYSLPWGQKQLAKADPTKDDVRRRYANIVRLTQEVLSAA